MVYIPLSVKPRKKAKSNKLAFEVANKQKQLTIILDITTIKIEKYIPCESPSHPQKNVPRMFVMVLTIKQ